MRGFAKRLKPLFTPTLHRAMEGVGPERGYALCMWYHAAYTRMTTEVERLDDEGATADEIADALDALDLDPPPEGLDATLTDIIRGEAQDLVEAAVVKTFAARDKKRAQRIRKARDIERQAADLADDLSDDRPEDEDCPGCPDCPGDNGDNGGQPGQRGQPGTAPPSPAPSSLSPMIPMRQSVIARAPAREGASKSSGFADMGPYGTGEGPAGTSQKREVSPRREWRHYRNPDGLDPVDIAIDAACGDPNDEDERRCFGANLKALGVAEFLECVHEFEIDAQTGTLRNGCAALNDRMRARAAILRLASTESKGESYQQVEAGGTPLSGPANQPLRSDPRTAGPDGARD